DLGFVPRADIVETIDDTPDEDQVSQKRGLEKAWDGFASSVQAHSEDDFAQLQAFARCHDEGQTGNADDTRAPWTKLLVSLNGHALNPGNAWERLVQKSLPSRAIPLRTRVGAVPKLVQIPVGNDDKICSILRRIATTTTSVELFPIASNK